MSTIDDRIVKLRLDNENFEKNASISMSTLEKLQSALSFGKGTDISANFNLSGISSSVNSIANRFSNLGIVGMTALQNITNSAINLGKSGITNVLEKIFQGGKKRALNIEQAKFQLEGLKVAWDDISEDIDYGVKGTAYGLDAAARAASQLVASGVEVGDSMKTALRGISGVAAMTNSEYEAISPIFTTISGQGRMMTMQLRQLENRGLNAAATLRDYFNSSSELMDEYYKRYTEHKKKNDAEIQKGSKATESAIRTMVTNGAIDFEVFSKAMDSAFGEHAKDANKTYEGSLRNVGAALSRIGAKIQTPKHEAFRRIYVSLIPVIDKISSKLDPLFKLWEKGLYKVAGFITKILDSLKLDWIDHVIKAIKTLYSNVTKIGGAIAEAFKEIFPKDLGKNASNFVSKFSDFIAKFKISEKTLETVKNIFKGLFTVIKIVGSAFLFLGKIIKKILTFFGGLIAKLGETSGSFSDFVKGIKEYIEASGIIERTTSKIDAVLTFLKDIFTKAKHKVIIAITKIKEAIKSLFGSSKDVEKFGKKIGNGFDDITTKLKTFKENVDKILDPIKRAFKSFSDKLSIALAPIKDKFVDAFGKLDLSKVFESGVMAGLLSIVIKLVKTFNTFLDKLGQLGIGEKIGGVLDSVRASLQAYQDDLKSQKILRIAESLVLLAVGILILSKIPFVPLVKGLGAMTISLLAMVGIMKLLSMVVTTGEKGNSGALAKAAVAFIELGAAMILLALALKIIASANPETMNKSFGILVGLLVGIVLAVNKLASDKANLGSAALLILAISFSMSKIAKALKKLSKIDPAALGLALGTMITSVGLIGMLIGFSKEVKNSEIESMAVILIGFATSMYLIALAFQQFDKVQNIGNGLLGMVAALAALGAFVGVMHFAKINPTELITLSGSLIIFAGAMLILSVAMEKLGKLQMDEIGRGFIAIFGAFGGMLLIAAAFSSFIPAFAAFAVVLIGIGAACLLVATSVLVFATALGILAVTGVAAIPALIALITAFCATLPMVGKALGSFLVMMILEILNNMTLINETILNMFVSLLETILIFMPVITDLALQILLAFLNGINEHMVEITQVGTELIVNFIIGILNGLAETAGDLVDATYNYIVSWINAIADGMDEHTDEVLDALDRLWEATKKAALKIWDRASTKVREWGTKLIETFKEKASQAWTKVKNWFASLPQEIKDKILEKIDKIKEIGSDIMTNIKEGLLGGLKKVTDAASNIGRAILDAFKGKKALDERSPSHAAEKIGEYADKGLVNGLKKGKKEIVSVVNDISSDVKSGLNDVPDRLHSIFEDIKDHLGVNDSPVIKPVVDLSDVEKSGSKINSIFGSSSVSGGFLNSILPTKNLASGIGASQGDILNDPKMASSLRNFTFIQNNNSPKALSRIDIYRQTRNQLEDFKELGMFDKTG